MYTNATTELFVVHEKQVWSNYVLPDYRTAFSQFCDFFFFYDNGAALNQTDLSLLNSRQSIA